MPPPAKSSFGETLATYGRLVRLVRPYWGSLGKSVCISMVVGTLALLPPYLAKLMVDMVFATHDVNLLHLLIASSCTILMTSALLSGLRTYFTATVTLQLTSATTLMFYNHLQHLKVRFFDEHQVGEVTSRFQEVRTGLGTASRVLESLLLTGVFLVLVPVFLLMLDWRLAILTVSALVLPVAIMFASGPMLRRNQQKGAQAFAGLAGWQVEMLSHIRTLKGMGLEQLMYERAASQTREAVRVQLRGLGITQVTSIVQSVVRAMGVAMFTLYAWTLILRGDFTLGEYVAFTSYVAFLTGSLLPLPNLFVEFQSAGVSLSRMFEYLDETPEQDPSHVYTPQAPLSRVIRGELRMRGVHFGYTRERPILNGVDLVFEPGSVTAVVGPSGTGKSTLLRLAMRLEEPWAGTLLMDGAPLGAIPLTDLRRQVAVVWQEVSTLRGTLWDNLTLGSPGATREQVDEAVRICRLAPLIAELPKGYDTPMAEWGSTVSGGQRQRISLARALVRDTPVLLLDEATSNLDMETEGEILRDLFRHVQGKTLVFVTHRVSTAALADRICVVEHGVVAAEGTHDHLLDTSDLYRRLCGVPAGPHLVETTPHAGKPVHAEKPGHAEKLVHVEKIAVPRVAALTS
jgi:ABC-type bacteriocin/lantibiotic exporter with double-glycine peptidase domain